MQKMRVVLVTTAAAALGAGAVVLGFIAERAKSKSFVGYTGQRCVYQRTAALTCGVAAALLALAAVALVTAATGCFGRYGGGGYATGRRRVAIARLAGLSWVLVVVAVALFLYGAWMNRGGTRGVSTIRPKGMRYDPYYYSCLVLKTGVFASASITAAVATACAIAAYVYQQQADEETAAAPVQLGHQYAAQGGGGVAMGQPQWAQPYPPQAYPTPVGYPAPPPYGGYAYGANKQQPGGTA